MLINMQQFFAEWGEIERAVERGGRGIRDVSKSLPKSFVLGGP